ncbi:hypothetical protein VFPPC_15360 [Pochonia chlamydosporia 170]|uniref:Uncharacterized protein n=1 Tax=Pochonia chlamydosporia 170 TaxID=1380566 RepID=A0A179G8R3_METCM|nr:hypothetical protein VFPPC_15360 [Pochonia chlamydosporia 170]OAQ73773.1 hypothetical protein VFPPC_15360 [Pochonia chlamydosporia 170]
MTLGKDRGETRCQPLCKKAGLSTCTRLQTALGTPFSVLRSRQLATQLYQDNIAHYKHCTVPCFTVWCLPRVRTTDLASLKFLGLSRSGPSLFHQPGATNVLLSRLVSSSISALCLDRVGPMP